jgi:hypothetical protein
MNTSTNCKIINKKNNTKFSKKVRDCIKKNFNNICAMCHMYAETGQAAHIISASETGPRSFASEYGSNDTNIIDIICNNPKNGLWLCYSCHQKIDNKPEFYSVDNLQFLRHLGLNNYDDVQNKINSIDNANKMLLDKITTETFDENFYKYFKVIINSDNHVSNFEWFRHVKSIVIDEIMDSYIAIDSFAFNDFIQHWYFAIVKNNKLIQMINYDETIMTVAYYLCDQIKRKLWKTKQLSEINEIVKETKNFMYFFPISDERNSNEIIDLIRHTILKHSRHLYNSDYYNYSNNELFKYCRYYINIGVIAQNVRNFHDIEDEFIKNGYDMKYICVGANILCNKNQEDINIDEKMKLYNKSDKNIDDIIKKTNDAFDKWQKNFDDIFLMIPMNITKNISD